MREITKSNVRLFLLGLVGNYSDFYGMFENAYLAHETNKTDNDVFYILVSKKNLYEKVRDILILSDTFESLEDINDGFALYTFRVPEEFKFDFSLIKKGRYSRVSNKYKELLLERTNTIFNGVMDKESKLYKVLYRDPRYRESIEEDLEIHLSPDAELFEVPDLKGVDMFKYSDV